MRATTDLAGALALLRALPAEYLTAEAVKRGIRWVELARAVEMRDGCRTQRAENWVRYGFRVLSRWAVANRIH